MLSTTASTGRRTKRGARPPSFLLIGSPAAPGGAGPPSFLLIGSASSRGVTVVGDIWRSYEIYPFCGRAAAAVAGGEVGAAAPGAAPVPPAGAPPCPCPRGRPANPLPPAPAGGASF